MANAAIIEIVVGDNMPRAVPRIRDRGTQAVIPTTGLTAKLKWIVPSPGSDQERTLTPLAPASDGKFAYQFVAGDFTTASDFDAQVEIKDGSNNISTTFDDLLIRVKRKIKP